MARGKWYRDGLDEGCATAEVVLSEPVEQAAIREAIRNDTVGEISGGIREHQVQMAGDISYDVDRPGGPTEEQYERWEEGFFAGFEQCLRKGFRGGRRRD